MEGMGRERERNIAIFMGAGMEPPMEIRAIDRN